ncbi:MAG: hypothetical protein EOP08_03460 [Proteobacteria bacterium]|nr:MAG: hypothetical protein EOP08_03460 [Pseudomonadota bacterium]
MVDATPSVRWVLSGDASCRIIGGTFRRDLPGPAYDNVVVPFYVPPSVRTVLESWLAPGVDEYGRPPMVVVEDVETDDLEEFQWTVEHLVSLGWTPEGAARDVAMHEENVEAIQRCSRWQDVDPEEAQSPASPPTPVSERDDNG